MLLLFVLYLAAVAAARRVGRRGPLVAMAGGALLMAVMLPAHPFYSFDVLHYIATTRVLWEHGANPLITPPRAFPADPLVHLPDWDWLPSPYGPAWAALTALPHYTTGGTDSPARNLIAFKLLSAGCALGTAWLAGATAERLRAGARATAIVVFAWNPLLVLHTAGDAHNDTAMLLFLALALYLLVRGWIVPAAVAMGLSALVKFASLLVLPVFVMWLWRSGRGRGAVAMLAVPLMVAVAAYAPFWEGPRTLRSSLDEGRYLTTSIPAALAPALEGVMSRDHAETALTMGARLLFLPVLALALLRTRGDAARMIAIAGALLLLYLLIAASWLMPWYALWPLLPAAIIPWQARLLRPVLAFSLGALLLPVATNYLTAMSGRGDAWPPMNLVAVVLLYAPVVGMWLWDHWSGRLPRGPSGEATEAASHGEPLPVSVE
jgi:hypothetical protein